MPELHVPETAASAVRGGRGGSGSSMARSPDPEQQEIDALAQRAMDEAAANGGGILGKLIGGFLVCYICCGLSCFGGAVALVVLGVNRLVDGGADGSDPAATDTPDNGLLLLMLGVFPITALVVCVIYIRAQDAGWFRPENVSPNGLAAKRKADMTRQGRVHDMDEDDEREADTQQIAGPVGAASSQAPAVAPATMRISAPPTDATTVTPDADAGANAATRSI